MEYMECKKGRVVFEIGSQGDLFYLILDGVIEITIPDPNLTHAFHEINNNIDKMSSQLGELKKELQDLEANEV